jgi:hypothetical protein
MCVTRDHVVVSMVIILFYTPAGGGSYLRGGIDLIPYLPPVILFPVKTTSFSALRRRKISLKFAFWQGLWVPGRINFGAKNSSV